jgi:polyketide cyclase/dehydrase/lipid transport protein
VEEHHYEIEVDATPQEVWEVFWYRGADKPKPDLVTIDILSPGDEHGEGLVRHCTFPVPKVLGSGGVGKSWEWVTQVKPYDSWRYDAIGKPLWSRAEGHIELHDLGDGRTRVHFTEKYEAFNPWMRRLGLEKWVHEKLSRDNDSFFQAINKGLEFHRARKARAPQDSLSQE